MLRKINILYIETGAGFGGAVTCLAVSLRGLDKEKYNATVISSHNDEATQRLVKNAGAKFLYFKGYKRSDYVNSLIYKSAKIGFWTKGIVLCAIYLIEKILQIPFFVRTLWFTKRNNIDIIHFNTGINVNSEGILVSKLLNIPSLCHVRGEAYNSLEAKCLAKYVTCFIAVSKFIETSLIDLGISKNKIKVIYDGISADEYSDKVKMQDTAHYEFGENNIGLFACLLPWKGQKVFIEAANILIKENGLESCKFFVVGDIPEAKSRYKEELISEVKRLGLSDKIIFTGYQDNVYKFMNKMDIIVHTSLKPEPFGRVIIEAMALGKPVIATKMGGPLEIIEDKINGTLIPPGNPHILAETITFLLKDADELKQIGKRAQETIAKKFNAEDCFKNTEKLYERVMSGYAT